MHRNDLPQILLGLFQRLPLGMAARQRRSTHHLSPLRGFLREDGKRQARPLCGLSFLGCHTSRLEPFLTRIDIAACPRRASKTNLVIPAARQFSPL